MQSTWVGMATTAAQEVGAVSTGKEGSLMEGPRPGWPSPVGEPPGTAIPADRYLTFCSQLVRLNSFPEATSHRNRWPSVHSTVNVLPSSEKATDAHSPCPRI